MGTVTASFCELVNKRNTKATSDVQCQTCESTHGLINWSIGPNSTFFVRACVKKAPVCRARILGGIRPQKLLSSARAESRSRPPPRQNWVAAVDFLARWRRSFSQPENKKMSRFESEERNPAFFLCWTSVKWCFLNSHRRVFPHIVWNNCLFYS